VAIPIVLTFPAGASLPTGIRAWSSATGIHVLDVGEEELIARALQGQPRVILLDARSAAEASIRACRRLKSDSYAGSIPTVLICHQDADALTECFRAGADEVVHDGMSADELRLRLDGTLRRSDRDVGIHPSTRLPGTVSIEAELARRIGAGEVFGVCYADLDHFKEYNDRYSYHDGDRVIRVLSRLLHDVVKGICSERGFVGHIGGDDFIAIMPAERVADVCAEAIAVFDILVPYQYSEPDRRAGYFFGKDRRGQLHRVPLMTLSIGVVTNERRAFTSPSQVSELATEMKGYAKTLPGSVFAVDRRQDHLASAEATPVSAHQALIIGADK
jgi:GGDEF domain-containing protein